jgi:hypothetical protein
MTICNPIEEKTKTTSKTFKIKDVFDNVPAKKKNNIINKIKKPTSTDGLKEHGLFGSKL